MVDESNTFDKVGFPIVKIHLDYFEIKAIDFWDFREFKYSDLKKIEYYNPNDKWWNKIFISGLMDQALKHLEPSILKITKINGGTYKYKCPQELSIDLKNIINLIKTRCI